MVLRSLHSRLEFHCKFFVLLSNRCLSTGGMTEQIYFQLIGDASLLNDSTDYLRRAWAPIFHQQQNRPLFPNRYLDSLNPSLLQSVRVIMKLKLLFWKMVFVLHQKTDMENFLLLEVQLVLGFLVCLNHSLRNVIFVFFHSCNWFRLKIWSCVS